MTVTWQGNLTTTTVTLEKYNDDFNKTEKSYKTGHAYTQCLGRETLGILCVFYCSQDNIFVVRIINRRISIQIQL